MSESTAAHSDGLLGDVETNHSIATKYGLVISTVAPLLANVVGSVFNIWYNRMNIEPLLTDDQLRRFLVTTGAYNLVVYPLVLAIWIYWIISLRSTYKKIRLNESIQPGELQKAQSRVINIPWLVAGFCVVGWFGCIPVFIWTLNASPDVLNGHVNFHLISSFVIAGAISITQAFFIAELCCLKFLYPKFFEQGHSMVVKGAVPRGLRLKWILWAFSAIVCPVGALLLLIMSPIQSEQSIWFAISVGLVFILFGIISAWLMGSLVMRPIRQLREAAQRVKAGDLTTQVETRRADDFGLLIHEFNKMVEGLKEKEHIATTFGRHVGRQAATAILESESGLHGSSRVISVMFVDVRSFTSISSTLSPEQVVEWLNIFFQRMVEIVETNGGMVNKFLGDGLMALFGAAEVGSESNNHAERAVRCAMDMVKSLPSLNHSLPDSQKIAIGVGVHTGMAVVGSIGSEHRLEYTAIGDTVNVASRVEGLTKHVGQTILITEATRAMLPDSVRLTEPIQATVKGKSEPLGVYGVQNAAD